MQVSNSSSNYLQQYLSHQSALTSAAGRYGQSSTNASQAATPASANPVTLSDAARALSAQDNGSSSAGSSDFSQEAQLLGGFADKALAAMGVISPSDESGVQISFDSLAYQVDSSVSASQTQQGGQVAAQYSQEQDATFSGAGHITLANGQTFDFQIQLEMDQTEQYSSQGSADSAAQGLSLPSQASPAKALSDSSAPPDTGATSPAQGAGSGLINWDAILKQSKSLIDLLDSLAASGSSSVPVSGASANDAPSSAAAASA